MGETVCRPEELPPNTVRRPGFGPGGERPRGGRDREAGVEAGPLVRTHVSACGRARGEADTSLSRSGRRGSTGHVLRHGQRAGTAGRGRGSRQTQRSRDRVSHFGVAGGRWADGLSPEGAATADLPAHGPRSARQQASGGREAGPAPRKPHRPNTAFRRGGGIGGRTGASPGGATAFWQRGKRASARVPPGPERRRGRETGEPVVSPRRSVPLR
jgi:hypothetical protein